MTRPVHDLAPFQVVAAPSRSRPQIPVAHVRADALRARAMMSTSGIAGFTEISRTATKAAIRDVFGHRSGIGRTDCPLVWTSDFTVLQRGVDFGCAGIPIIAPTRRTSWALLRRDDGLVVGAVSTHMHPGGWARHPSRAQRIRRALIRRLWLRHAKRIQARIDTLARRADVLVMVGDINRPDTHTWHGLDRVTGRGLLYVGVGGHASTGRPALRKQHADHAAAAVTVIPKEHR